MITTNGSGPRAGRPSRRTLWIVGGTIAAVIVVSALLGTVLALEGVGVPTRPKPLPGLMTGPVPWGSNTPRLRERLRALEISPSPQSALPIVARLQIYVHGQRIRVPAHVGVLPDGRAAPLYTVANRGDILGVQASRRLGLFFKIWGLRFTKSCLGGYCGTKPLVTVNGAPVPGDPRRLLLRGDQEIVVSTQG